jgi:prepilin-type N-terminal cleavage/methylation domain-containing protein
MKRAIDKTARQPDKRERGFTLIEAAIVVVIIGVVSATTLPNVSRYLESGRTRAAARSVADAFNVARAQAIRTGSNHIVFFSIGGAGDTAGNTLQKRAGQPVPILVLNDGAPGSANQNCEIDTGEGIIGFDAQDGVGWGANAPTSGQTPPDEQLAAIPASGSSFLPPNSTLLTTPVTWVQFRPDGVPVAVDGACNTGRLGSGGGTIYLWSTNRDFAITLSPLGGVRVHTFDAGRGAWSI